MRDLWFEYFEHCQDEGIEDTHEGFQDWLYDRADLALGSDGS